MRIRTKMKVIGYKNLIAKKNNYFAREHFFSMSQSEYNNGYKKQLYLLFQRMYSFKVISLYFFITACIHSKFSSHHIFCF